jgi:periplasmic protein TonB
MHVKPSVAIVSHLVLPLQQAKRMVPLSLIILAHIGFLYALESGLLRQSGQATQPTAPKEIIASFVTAEDLPQQKPLTPQKPQTMLQVQPTPKQIVTPIPIMPVPKKAPSEQAITTPPVATQPVAPTQPAAAAAATAPSAPSTPAISSLPKTITSGVEYLRAPEPEYPRIAKRMGEEGRVLLRVLVNEKGRAERAEVQKTSGSTRLDEAAQQALMRTLFKPHTEDGKPVAVFAIVPITFNLDK